MNTLRCFVKYIKSISNTEDLTIHHIFSTWKEVHKIELYFQCKYNILVGYIVGLKFT